MDRPGEAGSWCGNKSSHHHSSLKGSQFIATYTHETSDSWSSEVGDRQQLIAFMSDKPINEVMLKRLLEACLVKPTDGIRMELNSISRNDDQGACAPHNSSLGVDCSRSVLSRSRCGITAAIHIDFPAGYVDEFESWPPVRPRKPLHLKELNSLDVFVKSLNEVPFRCFAIALLLSVTDRALALRFRL